MDISFADVAAALQHPLALVGYALFLTAGLFRAALKSDKIPVVDRRTAGRLVLRLPLYLFILALLAVIGSFALEFWRTSRAMVDVDRIVDRIVAMSLERARLERKLDESEWHVATLRETIATLRRRASSADVSADVERALNHVAEGGAPEELVDVLSRAAERAEREAEAAGVGATEQWSAAIEAWRLVATLAWWTDIAAARRASRRILELAPGDEWAWINLGRLAEWTNDTHNVTVEERSAASRPIDAAPPDPPQPVVAADLARDAQVELRRLGHYTGAVDGIWGPVSVRAMRAFERAEGLAVTGIVTADLLRRLQAARNPEETTASAPRSPPTSTSGCRIVVANPLAVLQYEPQHFAAEISQVPSGEYVVLAQRFSPWVGGGDWWFKIAVEGRQGWVRGDTWSVARRIGAACP